VASSIDQNLDRRDQGAPDRDDVDRLIAELRARGVDFLTGGRDEAIGTEVAARPLPPAELLRRLASCREPSIRDATIALLLLHPELAADLPPTVPSPADPIASQLAVLALAAVYLQREWRVRLVLALGERSPLPARYWHEWHLPDPDTEPEYGLRMLAARERARAGRPVNYLAMWQQQIDHLTSQAWRARRRARGAIDGRGGVIAHGSAALDDTAHPALPTNPPSHSVSGAMGMPHSPPGGTPMSMRAPADRERIERFLTRLGGAVQQPGRIYLVGGTTMVYEGYRATTIDIDVFVEADNPGALMAAIRALKDTLDINVEFASPRDFIPLPAGWRERSIYVGRYGPLDVFHFDLYSMALSKIERGTERDFQDVVALIQSGRIDLAELDAAFHEILPRVATEGMAGMDPDIFVEHYRYLRSLADQRP
jgi:hypothetical protein